MKPISLELIKRASKIIEDKPYLANGIYFSGKEEKKYKEREIIRVVRSYSVVIEKYLKSKEGQETIKLFKQVWEIPDKEKGSDMTLGWLHWRIFLYKAESREYLNEIIWFGGNGLELYSWDQTKRKDSVKIVQVSPRELVTRMSLNTNSLDQAGISRPEQVVPFIRLNAMDLVRYLRR